MNNIFAPENDRENIRGWLIHARKYWKMHLEAAVQLESRHRIIGTSSIILSAIVGAALFSSLELDFGVWGKIAAGGLSIIASVLASLLTFQRYEERAETHRKAAAGYKAALRTLERLHTKIHSANEIPDEQTMTQIKGKLDTLDEMSPVVPEKIFEEIEKGLSNFVSDADDLLQEEKAQT